MRRGVGAADQGRNLYSPRNAGHLDHGGGGSFCFVPLISRPNIDGRIYMLSMSKLLIPLPPSNQPTPFAPVQLPGHALPTFDTNSTFDTKRRASRVTSEGVCARSMFFAADR